ncbi:MAG: ABC transporter ATP-binding protein [Bacteroidetes bacterium]|nr:MAG: ABC transporter ATP-binding protein [Bacteroidota bacterium]
MQGTAINVRDVWFSYQADKPVLRGLTLQVRPGEIVGLLGANGAGKTTTFRLLASLLRPDAGTIHVAGVDVQTDPRTAKQRCAYVPDEPLLYPHLSALENLNLFGVLWGVPAEQIRTRTETLLREVGLWEVRHNWVRTYSRGMRQKLALCAALLHAPDVLLMDEPFTGLDIEAGLWARTLLEETARAGCGIVFTSHVPELVEAFASRVAILHEGRVTYDEPVAKVRQEGGMVAVFLRVQDGLGPVEVTA